MRPPRVSILGMMLFVGGISLAFVALRFSTPNVAGSVLLGTLFGLGLAILAAIYRRDDRRAFWVGFLVLGWGYLGAALVSDWVNPGTTPAQGKGGAGGGYWASYLEPTTPQRWLITSTFLDAARPSLQASSHGGVPLMRIASFLGGNDPRSRAIINVLNRPLSMPFANETPLEEILKYIKTMTTGPGLPEGIPIYVDPIGFQEAEKTLSSPVTINLEGVPLRKTLALLLRGLDLIYTVDDGLLTITASAGLTEAELARSESFRRVGHCLFAFVSAMIGGFAARLLHATRWAQASDSPLTR